MLLSVISSTILQSTVVFILISQEHVRSCKLCFLIGWNDLSTIWSICNFFHFPLSGHFLSLSVYWYLWPVNIFLSLSCFNNCVLFCVAQIRCRVRSHWGTSAPAHLDCISAWHQTPSERAPVSSTCRSWHVSLEPLMLIHKTLWNPLDLFHRFCFIISHILFFRFNFSKIQCFPFKCDFF